MLVPSGRRSGTTHADAAARARIRSSLHRSFDRALLAVLAAGGLLVTLQVLLLPLDGPMRRALLLFPLTALVYLVSGLLAWRHRPSSLMGALILLAGAAVYLVGAGNIVSADSATAGLSGLSAVVATLPLAVLVHLLLAFPTGRVRSRWARATVWLGYVTALVLQLPEALWGDGGVAASRRPELAESGAAVQAAVGGAVLAATGALLLVRLWRATQVERRVLAPLYGYGVLAIVLILASSRGLPALLGWGRESVGIFQLAVLAVVPVAFALGVLRGGVARTGELEEIGAWLGGAGDERPAIAAVLARALGDPSLEVWFRAGPAGGYVDVHGVVVDAAPGDPRRGVQVVELDGRRIGAIAYDLALLTEPELVRTASRVTAIALDRERLSVELRASRVALQRSRERLVEVADTERRRIAQDLHDGLQVKLVLLGLAAQQLALPRPDGGAEPEVAAAAVELRRGIDDAAAELRDLVHMVMPATLVQRGLSAAAEDLADRMPIPTELLLGISDGELAPAVESTAYFVVAEALNNAVKHSGATEIRVRLARAGDVLRIAISDDGRGGAAPGAGAGLTGLAERVDVLGGSLRIESDSGAGTTIEVELPCAS
ncbi:sensor histidine kinase [Leucobacter luti]|uniref:sensor histidine kinase n=1 Tax=Leucobacter luti TaxID=340320 RepID=UPI00102CB74E|nr:ATP-binding protein [Leucobacter luti]MBL3700192.1 sensor histidine kinase [Leucobacter luti]